VGDEIFGEGDRYAHHGGIRIPQAGKRSHGHPARRAREDYISPSNGPYRHRAV
jgi:hypothetical protein